ncbi:hypothetical protein ANRL2_02237 [Anaerolineae bacterium]|nr:hypothetical protein ANRL2_02237 [Anaerolineae bacterium]
MTRLRPWQVVLAISLIYAAITLARGNFDPRFFALIGPLYDPGVPGGQPGYDGQFAYQIARDPANGWTKTDVPAYRYQRILYPLAARVLGLGSVDLIPWALIAINVIALVAGTFVTEEILAHYGANRWYALAYGLNAGTLMGVRLDLTEPLAYSLAQAGVWLLLKNRSTAAAIALALAALTKEMTLMFAAGVVLTYLAQRDWRNAIKVSVIAATPFAIWQLILYGWFGQFGVGSGGALATPFEIVPLRGLWSIAAIDGRRFVLIAAMMLPLAVIPALIGLWRTIGDARRRRFDLPMWLLLINAAVIVFTPQSTFREPLAMARFVAGLIAATLMYAAARRSKRGLNYALLWVLTLGLALNESQLPI